jgi:ATP-dependent Clp protease adaptor protein ClpS
VRGFRHPGSGPSSGSPIDGIPARGRPAASGAPERPSGPATGGGILRAVGTETPAKPVTGRPGSSSGHGEPCHVIVLNDDHNTFEHVARSLARFIPGVGYEEGMALATKIHNAGRARVWSGVREQAELYWEQLKDAGLTMAPLA